MIVEYNRRFAGGDFHSAEGEIAPVDGGRCAIEGGYPSGVVSIGEHQPTSGGCVDLKFDLISGLGDDGGFSQTGYSRYSRVTGWCS